MPHLNLFPDANVGEDLLEMIQDLLAGEKGIIPVARQTDDGHTAVLLTGEEIEGWRDPGYFISIAFGSPRKVQDWACPACEFVERPKRIRTGGNGGDVPRYLVATTRQNECLIAISGTDMKKPASVWTSADLRLVPLDDLDFPDAKGMGMQVHKGFRECWRRMRSSVRIKVEDAVREGCTGVTIAGYSLGAAMAFLCGVWLRHYLPAHIPISIKGYGTPRIGNDKWVKYVDGTPGIDAWRLVNYKDVVCRIPPKSMGYRHPRNEVFILKDGESYQQCRERDCKQCSGRFDSGRGWLKVLHRLRRYKDLEHFGPYAGVMLHPDLVCTSSSSLDASEGSLVVDFPEAGDGGGAVGGDGAEGGGGRERGERGEGEVSAERVGGRAVNDIAGAVVAAQGVMEEQAREEQGDVKSDAEVEQGLEVAVEADQAHNPPLDAALDALTVAQGGGGSEIPNTKQETDIEFTEDSSERVKPISDGERMPVSIPGG